LLVYFSTQMKPKDIFNLIVRLFGLVFLYQALVAVPLGLSAIFSSFPHSKLGGIWSALMMIGWPLLLGYWMLRGARPLGRWAYPEE